MQVSSVEQPQGGEPPQHSKTAQRQLDTMDACKRVHELRDSIINQSCSVEGFRIFEEPWLWPDRVYRKEGERMPCRQFLFVLRDLRSEDNLGMRVSMRRICGRPWSAPWKRSCCELPSRLHTLHEAEQIVTGNCSGEEAEL